MPKLTDKTIKTTKAIDKDIFINDGGGLYLRILPSGWKHWLYRYKKMGKTNWVNIGTYPSLSLADARSFAFQITAKRKRGIDPVDEKNQEKITKELESQEQKRLSEESAARITVNDLFKRWLEIDLIRRKDKGSEIQRMFKKDVLPDIGDIAVEDIRKGHITNITDKLITRGVNRSAKLALSLIRQMFRFAVDRDIIEFDPSASIRKSKIGGKDVERDRVLSEQEIKELKTRLPASGLSVQAQNALWIALSTCCRIGELLTARWENVNFESKTWFIPPEFSKNGKPHTIFLSDFTIKKFIALKKQTGIKRNKAAAANKESVLSEWVYPNRDNNNHLCTKTITKQLGHRQSHDTASKKNRIKGERSSSLALAGGKWGPHDLRRTGATLMVMLGVLPEVAERCLNHTEQNRVKRTYQRHSYELEMQAAWNTLGKHLDRLT